MPSNTNKPDDSRSGSDRHQSSSCSSLTYLVQPEWWSQAFKAAACFAPHCLLPASLITGANALLIVTMDLVARSMKTELTLDMLWSNARWGTAGLLAACALAFWSLRLWLLRLTAFSEVWLRFAPTANRDQLSRSLDRVSTRGVYLTKFWLATSLLLTVPLLLLSGVIVLKVISSPESSTFGVAILPLPAWGSIVVELLLTVLSALITGYSLVALAVSSVSALSPGRSALVALSLSLACSKPLLPATLLVLALNCLSSPETLITLFVPRGVINQLLWLQIVFQLWFGIMIVFLWPLSICIVAELLRDRIE